MIINVTVKHMNPCGL